jgi:hypothetical protein
MARRFHPFMFYDELDWLECQLTETYDQMEKYILVEATLDHQGHEKPLHYDYNQARFERWADKIIHVVVTDLPTAEQTSNHWERERPQRDRAMDVLQELARPEDLIINMDVDEVPSQTTMLAETASILGLRVANHLFAVDWFAEMGVMGTLIPVHCLDFSRAGSEIPGAVRGGLSWVREHRHDYPVLENAGHHFSWTGGVAEYIAKDRRSPHTEHSAARMAPGEPDRAWREGAGSQVPCEVDKSYPRYIRERRCPESWFRPQG